MCCLMCCFSGFIFCFVKQNMLFEGFNTECLMIFMGQNLHVFLEMKPTTLLWPFKGLTWGFTKLLGIGPAADA